MTDRIPSLEDFAADLLVPSPAGPVRFGDIAADFQLEALRDLGQSLAAVAEGRQPLRTRFWWEMTKGCGKDTLLAVAMIWLTGFSRLPRFGQVGAADKEQAAELIKAARTWLHLNPWISDRVEVLAWRIVCEATGSEVEIIAADIAGSHGSRPDVLILNELHAVTRWEYVANLSANAAKVPHNVTIVATNAGFVDTDAWRWRELARTSPRWSFHQVNRPAPWISEAELAEQRKLHPTERYNRLFHGNWSHGTGTALSAAIVEPCLTGHGPHSSRVCQLYIGAVDLARKRDHAAFIVLAVDAAIPGNAFSGEWTNEEPPPRVELAHCRSWNPADYPDHTIPLEEVRQEILATHRRLRLDAALFDLWQAALMTEQLAAAGIRCIDWPFSPAYLELMARDLNEAFQSRWLSLYPDAELLNDLYKLNIVDRPQGARLDAKRDATGHADRAFALAIGLPTALRWSRELAYLNHVPEETFIYT